MAVNFRRILSGVDVGPLLSQIGAHPELWNYDDAWTRHKPSHVAIYKTDNIVLRFNSSDPDWNKPAFAILSAAREIVFDVMRALEGEHLGKVIITRLRAGEVIAPHIDKMPPGVPPFFQRYQIPLAVAPGVVFRCGDEDLFMEPGNAYWFDNQIMHSVVNDSDTDRISMLVDIRPFTESRV